MGRKYGISVYGCETGNKMNGKKEYQCDKCNKIIFGTENLVNHKYEVHSY